MQLKIDINISDDLFKEILIISKEKTLSEYIIQLMKDDLKRQNVKDGVAIQIPKLELSIVQTIKEGEFKIMTNIFSWLKEKFKNNRKKCIHIKPDKPWPRENHDK